MVKYIDLLAGQELRFIVKHEPAQFTVKSGRVELNLYPCQVDTMISLTGAGEYFLLATEKSKVIIHSGCQSLHISNKSWIYQVLAILSNPKFLGRENDVVVIYGQYHPVFSFAQSFANALVRTGMPVSIIDLFTRHSAISPATTVSIVDTNEPFQSFLSIKDYPIVYPVCTDDPLGVHLAKVLGNLKKRMQQNKVTIICVSTSSNLSKIHDIIPFSSLVCLSGELAQVQIYKSFDPEMDMYPVMFNPSYVPDFMLSADIDNVFVTQYFKGSSASAPLSGVSIGHQSLSSFTFYKYKVPFTDRSLVPEDDDGTALTIVEANSFVPMTDDIQHRIYGVLEDAKDMLSARILGYVYATVDEEDQITLLLPDEGTLPTRNLVWIGVKAVMD